MCPCMYITSFSAPCPATVHFSVLNVMKSRTWGLKTRTYACVCHDLIQQTYLTIYPSFCSVTTDDSAGVVYDGEDPGLLDIDYTDELTAITAHFFGFSSQSCGGLVRYEWAVGVESEGVGRETVMPFTDRGIVVGANGTGYAQVCVCVCVCV